MALNQLSKLASDGNLLGQAPADKIGFYGVQPIIQPVLAQAATASQIVDALTLLGLTRKT